MSDFTLVVGVNHSESYGEMLSGVNAIVREINANAEKINIKFNTEELRREIGSLKSELADLTGSMTAGTGGLGGFQQGVINGMRGIGEVLRYNMEQIHDMSKALDAAINDPGKNSQERLTAWDEYNTKIKAVREQISVLEAEEKKASAEAKQAAKEAAAAAKAKEQAEKQAAKEAAAAAKEKAKAEQQAAKEAAAAAKAQAKAEQQAAKEAAAAAKAQAKAEQQAEASEEARIAKRNSLITKYNTILQRLQSEEAKWTKASTDPSTSEAYRTILSLITDITTRLKLLDNEDITPDGLKELERDLGRIRAEAKGAETSIKGAGNAVNSYFDKGIKDITNRLTYTFSMVQIFFRAIQEVKKMISEAVEIDTALTQLQIVTRASSSDMSAYSKQVSQMAKETAQSTKDLIDATTVYARLGYTMDESSVLAKYTSMLQGVGRRICLTV